jgi:hypothetical protein
MTDEKAIEEFGDEWLAMTDEQRARHIVDILEEVRITHPDTAEKLAKLFVLLRRLH